jgi:hypothetical protein
MATSTKEEIQKAALSSFGTVEVKIGAATAVLRELSDAERKALDAKNYQMKDGELVVDEKGFLTTIDPKFYLERWIEATITPAFSVAEIALWPLSLKKHICEEAKKINGIKSDAETAKNS